MNNIPYGYCQCGCGMKTNIATRTIKRLGYIKGEPYPFVHGHKRKSIEERFWEKVEVGSLDICWPWKASRNKWGYGRIGYKGKLVTAPRLSYQLVFGDVPEGLCVCHSCDNPACVNPSHLYLGTFRDNNLDKMSKGRWRGNHTRGENRPQSKITEDKVKEIRNLAKQGMSNRKIAPLYNISHSAVDSVINGRTWSYVI